MEKEQKLQKHLSWYKNQVDVPFLAYVLGAVILWIIIGLLRMTIAHYQDMGGFTWNIVLEVLLIEGLKGAVFGVIMRLFSSYQCKRLQKKLDKKA